MVRRDKSLNELIRFKDKDLIKVVTGVRESGKSTLFELFIDYLKNNDVDSSHIIKINLEDVRFHDILDDYVKLYNEVMNLVTDNQKYYVFLDEVQKVKDFQKACDGLYIQKNIDLYITGSNSDLLSGELATLLSGRYIEIKMLPLSFKEFLTTQNDQLNLERLYQKYISFGSLPYVTNFDNIEEVDKYIKGIYDSIILNDVVARKKFPDLLMLKSVVNFLLDNIGNITSTNKIADTMTSNGRNISVHTVENYIDALLEAFIFYKVSRYDTKGKQYLKTGDKYYVVDPGIRYILLGRKQGDRGHILENVIYLELLRRGYEVYIGKVDDLEVDFVAINSKGIEYYQVAETTRDNETLERELKPLQNIKDNFPKYILTSDVEPETTYDGIIKINVLDWLISK